MGKRYGNTLKHRLCVYVCRRRSLSRQLFCLRKSLCEVYRLLNPGADYRK